MVNNTKYGSGALQNNTGNNNTAIGAYAAYNNLDASSNTAVGSNSSRFNTTGEFNTALGSASLCRNATGSRNIAIGSNALGGQSGESVGDQNVAVGVRALFVNSGDSNTAIGTYAALGVTGSSYNTFLGANTTFDNLENAYEYSTAIGYGSKIDASNQIMLGGTGAGSYPNVIIPGQAFLPGFLNTGDETQIVPKSYIDTIAAGLQPTQTCVCATTSTITLSSTSTTLPPPSSTDGFDLTNNLIDGSYNILVVNQDASNTTLTSSIQNGVWILYKTGSTGVWLRPTSPQPMRIGYDAVGAFSFIEQGTLYGKTALVQIYTDASGLATVGTDPLQYQKLYQLQFQAGQGLNTTIANNGGTILNVDTSLNFINYLDSTPGVTGASGTLNIGRNSFMTIIGPTGAAANPVIVTSGITGPTGSFTYLTTSKDAKINTLTVGLGSGNIVTNTVIGNGALSSNSNRVQITAIGYQSQRISDASDNTSVGYRSLYANTTGGPNDAFGSGALFNNQTGSANVAMGYYSLFNDVSGNYNTAIGYESQLASTASDNTSVGYRTLFDNITGGPNDAFGKLALRHNTIGSGNVAIGCQSLFYDASGNYNTSIGNGAQLNSTASDNTSVGYRTLYANTTGTRNDAFGKWALAANTIGSANVAMGFQSLYNDMSGNNNTAIGYESQYYSKASSNTSLGYRSGYNCVDGSQNTFIGANADIDVSTNHWSYSTALGYNAKITNNNQIKLGGLNVGVYPQVVAPGGITGATGSFQDLTVTNQIKAPGGITGATGSFTYLTTSQDAKINTLTVGLGSGNISSNTVVGFGTLTSNINCGNITAIGFQSQRISDASDNTSVGYRTLYANTTGTQNDAFGEWALGANTIGSSNVAMGFKSLFKDMSGNYNTAIGNESQYASTASDNTSVGYRSLYANTTGGPNDAFGEFALGANTIGSANVAMGYKSLFSDASGSYNTAIGNGAQYYSKASSNTSLGYRSGYNCVDGSQNTFIGANADIDVSTNTWTYSTALGYNAKITNNNQIKLGGLNAGVYPQVVAPGGITGATGSFTSVTASSYNATSDHRIKVNVIPLNNSFIVDKLIPVTYKNIKTDKQDIGLIAHELQEHYPYLVNGEKDGKEYQTVNYTGLIGILIKEVKDLKERVTKLENNVIEH